MSTRTTAPGARVCAISSMAMGGLGAIKGVLLDVGDTLTAPRGGRWNPRFDFEDTLRAFGLHYGTDDDLARAIAEGDAYLHQMAAKGSGPTTTA